MLVNKYSITNHALQRYAERTNRSKQDIKYRMLRDLNALRGKKIVKIGNVTHIFYSQPSGNVREFIVVQKKKVNVVTTVISRTKEESELAYQNRLNQKEEYENKKEDK